MANTAVPEDLLPDDLKPAAPPVAKKAPKAVPADMLPKELQPVPADMLPEDLRPTPVAAAPETPEAAIEKMLPFGLGKKPEALPEIKTAAKGKPEALVSMAPELQVSEPAPKAARIPKEAIERPDYLHLIGADIGQAIGGAVAGGAGRLVGAGIGAALGAPKGAKRAEPIEEERKEPEAVGLPEEATRTTADVETQLRLPKISRASWPTPIDVYHRVRGGGKNFALSFLGESKLAQEIEQPAYPDPDLPRPEDDYLGYKWDELKKNPDKAQEVRNEWKTVYAERKARGAPLHGEKLSGIFDTESAERFREPFEQTEKEREERRVRKGFIATPSDIAYNLKEDASTAINALGDMFAQTFGPQVAPETPAVMEAKRQLDEAALSGDQERTHQAMVRLETVKQEAIGGHLGKGIGMMPGQLAALAHGLVDFSNKNTLLTHPFTIWTTLVDPASGGLEGLRGLAAKSPALDAALTRAQNSVSKAAGIAAGKIVEAAPILKKVANIKDTIKGYLDDSLWTGNKRTAQRLENMIAGDDRGLAGLREQIVRQVEQGQEITPQTLKEIDIHITPAEDIRAGAKAERAAEKAVTTAEDLATRKAMSKETVEHVKELRKEVDKLRKAAVKVEERIASAATEADRVKLQKKLSELKNAERTLQKQFVPKPETALEKRAETVAGKAATAGVELAEQAQDLPEAAIAEQAAQRAAREQAPAAAGAARKAARLTEEAELAGQRPEVYAGKIYIPEEKIVAPTITEQTLVDKVQEAQRKAEASGTELSQRAVDEAQKDLDTYRSLHKDETAPHRVSENRKNFELLDKAADHAEMLADQADVQFHEEIKRWNAGKSDRQTFNEIRDKREAARAEADAAREKADAAERRYRIVREADVPKVPEMRVMNVKSREYLAELRKEAWRRWSDEWQKWTADPKNAPYQPVKEAAAALKRVDDMLNARELAEAPVPGMEGPARMEREFAEVPEQRRNIIEQLATDASDSKKAALEAGFDPNAKVSDEAAAKIGVPAGTSIYDAARRFTEHLDTINKGGQMDIPAMVREFLESEGVDKGAAEAGKWLNAEVQTQNAAAGMIEPAYGAVRRPTPVEETIEIGEKGELIPRPTSIERSLERSVRTEEGRPALTGQRLEMQKALDGMQDFSTKREPPKSIRTNNQEFDKLLDEYVKAAIDLSSKQDPVKVAADTDQLKFGDPNSWETKEAEATGKVLTPERLKQRVLEHLLDDTMQQVLHSKELQDSLLALARKRLDETDLSAKAKRTAAYNVLEKLRDPGAVSAASKNRFPNIVEGGKVILERKDFTDALGKLDPEALREAQSNAFKYEMDKINSASQSFAIFQNIDAELHRFKSTADPGDYAKVLANDVVRNNATYPLIMPFEGKLIADTLRKEIKRSPQDWTPAQIDRINKLADYVERFKDGENVEKVANDFHRKMFEGTDIKPPNMHNVHVDPAVGRALADQFATMINMDNLNGLQKTIMAVTRSAASNVVAKNWRSLANNNLSNSMLQIMTRGGLDFLPKLFTETSNFKRFLDGDVTGMTDKQVAMYDSINRRNALDRSSFNKQFGDESAYGQLKKSVGINKLESMLRGRDVNWTKPLEGVDNFNKFMVDVYTKAGDAPFRLEDMVHEYELLDKKLDAMEPGATIDLPVNKYNEVRVKNLGDGKFEITDVSGKREPLVVDRNSKELSDVFAAAADVAQMQKFLGFERMGLYGKMLKRGMGPVVSGIYSWGMAATDIPFLKKGLFSKVLEGPTSYKTTSQAIKNMQANEHMAIALKRALAINTAQAVFTDQRKYEQLRKTLDNNPSLQGTIVGVADNPGYIRYRNVAPLNFLSPTLGALNALSGAAQWLEYSPLSLVGINLDTRAQILATDPKYLSYTDEQMDALKEYNPAIYKIAEEQRKLAKEDPDAYEDRKLLKRDFQRWATGQISSIEDFLKTASVSGGPILRWMMDTSSGKLDAETAKKKFAEMVIGATPFAAVDVAAALAGEHGVKPAAHFSSFRSSLAQSGDETWDANTLAQYAARAFLGMGWNTAYFGSGHETPSSPHGYGKLKIALNRMRDAIHKSFLDAVRKETRKKYGGLPADELEEKAKETKEYKIMTREMDKALNEVQKRAKEQYRMLNKKPAPENE